MCIYKHYVKVFDHIIPTIDLSGLGSQNPIGEILLEWI